MPSARRQRRSVERGVGAVKWWRSGDGGGFPSLAAPLLDRDGEYRWGVAAQVNLVSRACRPPPLFIAQCDRAHQPCRVGRPRSERENKAQKAVGPNWWEIKPNILPLDLSSILRSLISYSKLSIHIFLASILFHHRLVHRTVPSSQQLVPLD